MNYNNNCHNGGCAPIYHNQQQQQGYGCNVSSPSNGHYAEQELCLSPDLIKEWYEWNRDTNVFTDKDMQFVRKLMKSEIANPNLLNPPSATIPNLGLTQITAAEKIILADLVNGIVPASVYSKPEITGLLTSKVNTVLGQGLSTNDFSDTYRTKVDALNISGTVLSDVQLKLAYENNPDTNAFTDTEKTKLAGLAATVIMTDANIKLAYERNADTEPYTTAEKASVAAMLANPALTDLEIKTAYENNLDTEAFTSAEKLKLATLATGAGFVTNADIKAAYEANLNTNAFTNADKVSLAGKLDAIAGKVLSTEDYTTAEKSLVASAIQDISMKVDKIAGMGLSETDFTAAEKAKLAIMESSHFKGAFTTLLALETAHATPEAGGYAYVNSELAVWDGATWVVVTGTPGTPALTSSQIKVLYEVNPDTNVYSDAEKVLLASALQTHQDITNKVDVLVGKSLSTNDYSNIDKALVASAIQTHQDISMKVDSVVGKGLSTEDYTAADKLKVFTALQAHQDITGKVDKVAGKQLSTEDYTTAEKTKLAGLEGSHFKGSHVDATALAAAYPIAEAGSYAYVLQAGKEHIYIWDGAAWADTGSASPVHLTDTQIKTQYENNLDTNAFTNADKATLGTALQTHQDITGKVDVIIGKQLSTEDYTTAEKTKLAGLNNLVTSVTAGTEHAITSIVYISQVDYDNIPAKVATKLYVVV